MKRLVMAAVMRVKPARVGRTVSWRRPGANDSRPSDTFSLVKGRVAAEIAAELVRLKVDVSSPTQPRGPVQRSTSPAPSQSHTNGRHCTRNYGAGRFGCSRSARIARWISWYESLNSLLKNLFFLEGSRNSFRSGSLANASDGV